jgi:hypothetical protein
MVVSRQAFRFNRLACGGLVAILSCLPSAKIETTFEPSLAPAEQPVSPSKACRALISERGGHGPMTHELRWDASGMKSTQSFSGMVVGTSDELFELSATRGAYDPLELYGVGEPALRCEVDVLWARRLPHGSEQSLVEATPACTGTVDGKAIALQSNLAVLSAIGPLIGWRAQEQGHDPSPVAHLDYQTTDLRDFSQAAARDWLVEGPVPAVEDGKPTCSQLDTPGLGSMRGFALTWDEQQRVRVRVAYKCCRHDPTPRTCELERDLPRPDAGLTKLLPDADGLLHSPFGCGSIGLDGSVRAYDGTPVGRHDVGVDALLGVVFLPSDHAFDPKWVE